MPSTSQTFAAYQAALQNAQDQSIQAQQQQQYVWSQYQRLFDINRHALDRMEDAAAARRANWRPAGR